MSTTIWASSKDGDGFDSSTGKLPSCSYIAQTIYQLSSPRTSPSQDLLVEDLVTSNITQTYASPVDICITLWLYTLYPSPLPATVASWIVILTIPYDKYVMYVLLMSIFRLCPKHGTILFLYVGVQFYLRITWNIQ